MPMKNSIYTINYSINSNNLTPIGHLDFSAFVLLFLRRFFMCSKGV